KGGAILRMIEGYLGEEKFREGIRLYMRRHREGNATADDLWGALAEASGQPILELANGWIRQTGYPLVTLTEQGGRITVTQRRFFSDPQAAPELTQWLVPLVLRVDGRERRVLLKSASETVDTGGKIGWVLGRLAWLEHRGVDTADRPALQAWIRSLFAGAGAELGWGPAKGEDDERRLRRAAVLRALALVARDPASIAEATERFNEHLAHP